MEFIKVANKCSDTIFTLKSSSFSWILSMFIACGGVCVCKSPLYVSEFFNTHPQNRKNVLREIFHLIFIFLLFINKKATKMNEEKIARHLTFMQHPGK
jgi:hypothetical protein